MIDFRVEFRTPNGGKVSHNATASNEWQALVSATIDTAVQSMLVAAEYGRSPLDMLGGLTVSAENGSLDIHIYEVTSDPVYGVEEYEVFPIY